MVPHRFISCKMNWTARAFLSLALVCFAQAFAAENPWRDVPGGRMRTLNVPAEGRAGFTLLGPEQTGVFFTNSLDEAAAASNRVLYNGAGVAVGDFDQDGLPDIYFCSLNGRNTLNKNLGNWKFADVTEQCGLKRDNRYYRGAVFADINGDGWPDLLICVLGGGVECFLNDKQGKFADATAAGRTASAFASTTLTLADVDGNGTLDLYVANNRTQDIRDRGQVDLQLVNGKMAVPPAFKDRLVIINGQVLEYGEPDQLYLNDGTGRFAPISWTGGRFRNESGGPLTQPPMDWALSASFRDINNDGFPDLYVCNDFWTPDRLWLNDGKGRFRAIAPLALRNMCASSMGVDFADIDRDGDLDFFVVDMLSRDPRLRKRQKLAQPPEPSAIGAIEDRPQIMRNTLNLNRGDGTFAEIANYAGVAASEWSWSPVFLDVDLDGYEDLLITSGHAKDVQDMDVAAQIRARQHSWKGFATDTERQKAFTKELMEHMRLYPRLDTPIVAFRNRGDLRFEDVTTNWGTAQPGIHHAIATADFDGDGDLDLVVNNLGTAAGLYRNESSVARVAVRLRGLASNTQGIGAKVTLVGGPVPRQTQEVISGGRYMAGSEALLVFAAGKQSHELEVIWRSGKVSRLSDVKADCIYEISEQTASSATPQPPGRTDPLFKDVTDMLKHRHHEEPFNDFDRQPLLPRRLSQSGPGVSWFDVDGDGRDDLLIASGGGGKRAYFRNKGESGFEQVALDGVASRDQTTVLGFAKMRLLSGSASYEDNNTNAAAVLQISLSSQSTNPLIQLPAASAGPLALGDFDADGDLDLFVGGRVIPGRYPEAAPSRIFRFDGTNFVPDRVLERLGLANSALWTDLTGDGWPELVVGCEWGPIKVFQNRSGQLEETTAQFGLDKVTGWWNGITSGDLDEDGRLDIVAANWGLNSEHSATPQRPLELYFGDLLDRGVIDLIETEWDPLANVLVPRRRLDVLSRGIPALLERFRTHKSFSEASITEVLAPYRSRTHKLSVMTLASMVFLNRGDRFEGVPLPRDAQFSPAFGVNVADFNGDGHEDIFLSQNFFATEPETPRLDAGRGLVLVGDGTGKFQSLSEQQSGIEVYGEQRGSAVSDFDADGRPDLVVTQNGGATRLFRNVGAKPGVRVRLQGPPGNPTGVGAVVRVGSGAARGIHAGSGYCSQDGQVLVFAAEGEVLVRWPGGTVSKGTMSRGAKDLVIQFVTH